jgi:hypothetical protein
MRTLPWLCRLTFDRFFRPLLAIFALAAASAAWGASVSIDQGATQVDPANTQPVVFDVVFSQAVTGFTGTDVDLSASTVPGTLVAVVSGAGPNYTVSVSGATGPGVVVATIPAGVTVDGASAPNSASTSTDNAVTLFRPTVTIDQAGSQVDPTTTQPVVFDVVFNTAVTGFTGADVNLSASTAPGVLNAVVSGAGANYTVSVSGLTGAGTVVASIPTGATDGIGNQASTSVDNSVQANIAPIPATAIPMMDIPALFALSVLLLLTGAVAFRR